MTDVDEGRVPIAIKGRAEIQLDEIVKGRSRPAKGVLLGIFMSPLDVHIQRSPIAGIIHEVSYHRALYNHVMGSMFLRNLLRIQPMYTKSPHIVANERNIIHIRGSNQDAYVVQIADQQVNKIDCYVGPGNEVAVGQMRAAPAAAGIPSTRLPGRARRVPASLVSSRAP